MIARDTHVKLDRGAFTVSLDFELAWGTRGRPSASSAGPYLNGTRIAIDRMLELFDRYGVSATWVMVGGLMLGGSNRHSLLSDPQYDDIPLGNSETAPDWYADDIVAKIRDCHTPQEIGCHTLTHMYVNETETSRQQFDWELSEFVSLFDQLGLPAPTSFIFPKHYMHHFDLIAKHGFKCYRGPESGWFEQLPTARLRGAMRLLNSRLRRAPVVGLPSQSPEGLIEVPSSHFYAPFQSVGKYVSLKDRVAQAIAGLNAAARQKKIYHLWTHPFNMGCRTDELMSGLEQVLQHYQKLASAGEIEARPMKSFASCLDSDR
jgi:hypothetical protein